MKKAIVAALMVMAMVGCTPQASGEPVDVNMGSVNGEMVYVEIDGMPCIAWTYSYKGGITCDWDQWDGIHEWNDR